jgi:lipopolysaccharide/colanic/teichoic acid biosynthesis glycosyltransferase
MAVGSTIGVAHVGAAQSMQRSPLGHPRRAFGHQPSGVRHTRGLMFEVLPAPPVGLRASVKRMLDVGAATFLLTMAAPLLGLIALMVRVDSPGSVLLRQERVGRDMRTFKMYKFRSMVADADQMQAALVHLNQAHAPLFKIRDDPRMTTVGRLLRRLSLDELPQLINVVRGEMSLVGPRPPLQREVEEDHLRQRLRLRFTPGMTGLWQVSGRSELPYETMLHLDFTYMRTWSPLLDLKILLRTLPAVVLGQGAC